MAAPSWSRKDLLGIADLSADEIRLVLDTAASFREVAARPINVMKAARKAPPANLQRRGGTPPALTCLSRPARSEERALLAGGILPTGGACPTAAALPPLPEQALLDPAAR